MLTRFNELWNEVEREGSEELLNHMREIGYFEAPASGSNHLARRFGLLEHSINVTELMLKMAEATDLDSPRESLIIVGLLHDIGKASYFGQPAYIPNILKSGKVSEARPYERNKSMPLVPHEISAIHIITQFMELSEDELFAILYHNGLYTSLGYEIKNSGRETHLYLITHCADMIASRIIEK